MSRDYLLGAHLRDATGRTVASADTKLKPPDQASMQSQSRPFEVELALPVDPATRPGLYTIEVFALALPTYELLPPGVVVGPLTVADPSDTLSAEAEPPGTRVDAILDGRIRLAAVGLPATAVRAGMPLEVTLYWQQTGPIGERYKRFLHVAGEDGRPVAQQDGEPADGRMPTVLWRPGETVRDVARVDIPADLRPGSYRLLAGMYLPSTGARLSVAVSSLGRQSDAIELGQIEILPGR
jgi:hypothetical protein